MLQSANNQPELTGMTAVIWTLKLLLACALLISATAFLVTV